MTHKLVAHVWFCGDVSCNCYRAVVTREATFGIPRFREHVFEGTFFSEPGDEDWETIHRELEEAAARYGITLEDHYGVRIVQSAYGEGEMSLVSPLPKL